MKCNNLKYWVFSFCLFYSCGFFSDKISEDEIDKAIEFSVITEIDSLNLIPVDSLDGNLTIDFSDIYDDIFHLIPTQKIAHEDTIGIDLQRYFLSNMLDISYVENHNLEMRLFNDSLYIKSNANITRLFPLEINVNGQNISVMLYIEASGIEDSLIIHDRDDESINKSPVIIKDSYAFDSGDLVLNYKYISSFSGKNDLRENNTYILFENSILDSKYYYIFKDKIRIMLPESSKNGLLRICSLEPSGELLLENQTIISNGAPLSTREDEASLYFSNIYYLLIDRFLDADKTNNDQNSDMSIDKKLRFHGGDLSGVNRKLNKGYFENLGVSGILLSPLNSNPDTSSRESRLPFRKYMGFDGSWPIEPRLIDKRFGTEEELKLLVKGCHDKGIKLLLDFEGRYTHTEHPYYQSNPDWYETDDSYWGELFLPKFNYYSSRFIKQITLDASYWANKFDIDGFLNNFLPDIPHEFSRYYNQSLDRQLDNKIFNIIRSPMIFNSHSEFINPAEFDAQLNFSLYKKAKNHFSGLEIDFVDLNKSIIENLHVYQPINLMGTFTSLNNEARFISVADGQLTYHDDSSSAFKNSPQKISNPVSYEKLFMFTTMNNSLPGVPIIYYGEEYGQPGADGPDSKRDMKFQRELTILESHLKGRVSKLNLLRNQYPALSIGDFLVLRESKNYTVWLKSYYNEKIIIIYNLQNQIIDLNIPLPFEAFKLTSLLDDEIILLDNPKMANLIIPPYTTEIYLIENE